MSLRVHEPENVRVGVGQTPSFGLSLVFSQEEVSLSLEEFNELLDMKLEQLREFALEERENRR